MGADILIVGQGLAGTLLAWELEQAGISFAIADAGHGTAASQVAAGMINPITGQRLVKSVRIDEWLPLARASYRALEEALGIRLWQEMRIRRLFADPRERDTFHQKSVSSELAPFVGGADEAGFWIEGAARIDVRGLLAATRSRWRGRMRAELVRIADEIPRHAVVIDCTGVSGAKDRTFDFVPWRFSKGEILEIAVEGLAPDVILNRGHWVMPIGLGHAWVGATHEPGRYDCEPSPNARALLEASATVLLGDRPFTVGKHTVGLRVNLPDKVPVAGRHPRDPRIGLINGLGAKGVLWAPALARNWVRHLGNGTEFDPMFEVSRWAG